MNNLTDNEANARDDADVMRIRKKLMRLMLGSILITFVLVGLVLAAVIYKIMAVPQQEKSSTSVALDPILMSLVVETIDGALVSYSLDGEILVVRVENLDGGEELIVYNVRLQRIISRLKFKN